MGGKSGKGIIIDKGHNIPVYSPVCTYCKHLAVEAEKRSCKAFPGGIPLEIWLGLNKHTKSYFGDNGIQFEKANKE